MAEIPIERKSGVPWWVWLLAALLIVALLWWLLDDGDGAETAYTDAPVATGTMPTETVTPPAITSLAAIARPDAAIDGRAVNLDGVAVQQVISDAGFWIGASADERVYVLLNEQRTPGTPTEGRVDVNPGQTVNIDGTVRSSTEGLGQGLVLPEGVTDFIWADSVEIV